MTIGGGAQLCVAADNTSGRNQLGDGDTANSFACVHVVFLYFAWNFNC